MLTKSKIDIAGTVGEKIDKIYSEEKRLIPSRLKEIAKDPDLLDDFLEDSKDKKEKYIYKIDSINSPPSNSNEVQDAILNAVLSGMNLGICDAAIALIYKKNPLLVEAENTSVSRQLSEFLNSDAIAFISKLPTMKKEESNELALQLKELSKITAEDTENSPGNLDNYKLSIAQIFLDFYNTGLLATHGNS